MPHERDEEMRTHLHAWQSSGLTRKQYCQQHNLKTHMFSYYKAKFLRQSDDSESLIPVQVVQDKTVSGLILNLPNGLSLEIQPGFEQPTFMQVLSLLK